MLAALIAGHARPEAMAELARGRMRSKRAGLGGGVELVDEQHRFLLGQRHLDGLPGRAVEQFNQQIAAHLEALSGTPEPPEPLPSPPPATGFRKHLAASPSSRRLRQAVAFVDPLPGIDLRVAEAVLAETGPDMQPLSLGRPPYLREIMAPGIRESGGKRYSGKTTPGNPALRKALVQAAHSGARRAATRHAIPPPGGFVEVKRRRSWRSRALC